MHLTHELKKICSAAIGNWKLYQTQLLTNIIPKCNKTSENIKYNWIHILIWTKYGYFLESNNYLIQWLEYFFKFEI